MAAVTKTKLQNFIDGEFVDAADGATEEVTNPANGEGIAEMPLSTAEDVDRAVAAAKVRIAIARALPGRRRAGACRRPRRPGRGRRCTRLVAAGTLRRNAAAGRSTLAFSGRIGSRALRPGRYVVTLLATDAAGNISAPASTTFMVLAR